MLQKNQGMESNNFQQLTKRTNVVLEVSQETKLNMHIDVVGQFQT